MVVNSKGKQIINPKTFDFAMFRKQFPTIYLRGIDVTCLGCGKKWKVVLHPDDQTNLTDILPHRFYCDSCKTEMIDVE